MPSKQFIRVSLQNKGFSLPCFFHSLQTSLPLTSSSSTSVIALIDAGVTDVLPFVEVDVKKIVSRVIERARRALISKSATLSRAMEVLLSDENEWVELRQGVGRLVNAIIAVLGLKLAPGSTFFFSMQVVAEISSGQETSTLIECVRFTQQLVLFAPQAVSTHSHVQTLLPTLSSKQPSLRHLAVSTLHHLIEKDPVTIIDKKIENIKFNMLDEETDSGFLLGHGIESDSFRVAKVVPAWLDCFPIQGDLIEAKVVHDQLCTMVESQISPSEPSRAMSNPFPFNNANVHDLNINFSDHEEKIGAGVDDDDGGTVDGRENGADR
ncbi:hypothetical protein QJS04_geneDACA007480 [Acorus gramineus]|uniref:Uncharacterized protein n=1 Tax=Acorus gramineus TaxID=55184 RepID=A0AAV9B2W7_ACOGR|nr:hypothetical protein QJS04_geneDACA007480 [Acorus gramineus]